MEKEKASAKKVAVVDTASTITYSLVVGTALDVISGLNPAGIITNRLMGTAVNAAIGAPYGWWREFVFRKTGINENSPQYQKLMAEFLAYNTTRTPLYPVMLKVSEKISGSDVDYVKGTVSVVVLSLVIAPTLALTQDIGRRVFNISAAAERAHKD